MFTKAHFYCLTFILLTLNTKAQNTFPCDGKLYYFGDSSGVDMLSYIDNYTTFPVSVNVCPIQTASHNGLGANPVDHFLYYLDGTILQKLDAACNISVVCTLPGSSTKGCFDNRGRYWFDANGLQAMDIATCSIVAGPFAPLPAGTSVDLAFNPFDCHFYVASSTFTYKIDTLGNTVATIPGGYGVGGTIGGIALGEDGRMYGMPNNNTAVSLYAIDLFTGIADSVATFTNGTANGGGSDMASFLCNEVTAMAIADVDSGCPGLTVQFADSSSGIGNIITWNFDDPASGVLNNSSLPNPVHIFTNGGTYFVKLVVNSNITTQCVPLSSDSIVVPIVISIPTVNAGTDTTICLGDSIILNASGNGIYHWSSVDAISCDTCLQPLVAPVVSTTFYLNITDGVLACQNNDSVFVMVNQLPPAPVISSITLLPVCAGDSVLLNGNGNGYFNWFPLISVECDTCSTTYVFPPDTTYYTLLLTDSITGCSSQDSILVTVLNQPSITLSNNSSICNGDTITLSGNGNGTLLWLPSLNLSCDTCSTTQANPAVTTTYTLFVTDTIAGCQNSDSLIVTVNQLPVLTLSNDTAICSGNSLNLTANANGNVAYSWTPTTGLSCTNCPNPLANLNDSMVYTVFVTNSLTGCVNSDSVLIAVQPLPVVSIVANTFVCSGDSIKLTATGAGTYAWNTGSTNAIIYETPLQNTAYTVTGFNGICVASVSKPIEVINIDAPTGTDTTICSGSKLTLVAVGVSTIKWYETETASTPLFTGDTYTIDNILNSTIYYLLSDNGQCKSDLTQVHVLVNDCPTIIPNVFTPNGDGINDFFKVDSELYKDATVKVYNRWGLFMFEWTGIDGGWNGKINGNGVEAASGVYYFIAELFDDKGGSSTQNGFVELLR